MKSIKSKTYLVQHLLMAVAMTLTVMGFLLSAKTLSFFPSINAVTDLQQTQIEIGQAPMFFSHLCLFIAFVMIYLVYEFYSFKPAFYGIINMTLMIFLTFFIYALLKSFVLNPSRSHFDALLVQVIKIDFAQMMALALAILMGGWVALITASGIKKLTRDYFMFLRFSVATVLGFLIFTVIHTFISEFNTSSQLTMFLNGITPFSQFVALTMISVIPLYLLRLVLGIFRGRGPKEDAVEAITKKSKSLFKGDDPNITLPSESKQETPPVEKSEKEEITVSHKVKLDADVASV